MSFAISTDTCQFRIKKLWRNDEIRKKLPVPRRPTDCVIERLFLRRANRSSRFRPNPETRPRRADILRKTSFSIRGQPGTVRSAGEVPRSRAGILRFSDLRPDGAGAAAVDGYS